MLATPINYYKNNKMASQMKMAARGGFSSSGIFIRSSSTQTHHLVGGPDPQSNLAIVKLRSPRNQKVSLSFYLGFYLQKINTFSHLITLPCYLRSYSCKHFRSKCMNLIIISGDNTILSFNRFAVHICVY